MRLIGSTIVISTIVLLFAIHPVAAVEFTLTSFDTDKLVYEVGETIHMAAMLTADYEEPGYCYVGFYVTGGQGTIFSDAYYIDASPDPRTLYSSYTIHPDNVSPGINGTQVTAQFNYDFYDERFTDAGTRSVVVNVSRGHLEANPLTDLRATKGKNVTFTFKINSIFSETIGLSNESVAIGIANKTSLVYETSAKTSIEGIFSFTWLTENVTPSTYNLTVVTTGNDDFLPLNESFELVVDPPPALLNMTRHPTAVLCQSADGSSFETVTYEFRYLTEQNESIDGGILTWQSSFSNGSTTLYESGLFRVNVSFPVPPGIYTLNFTATHSSFQPASCIDNVTVVRRPLSILVLNDSNALAGSNYSLSLFLFDNLTGLGVSNIHLDLDLQIGTSSFLFYGETNQTGWLSTIIPLPTTSWGESTLTITTNASVYYANLTHIVSVPTYFEPSFHLSTSQVMVGETNNIVCTLSNPLGQPLAGVPISLLDDQGHPLASNYSDSDGVSVLIWNLTSLPPDLSVSITLHIDGCPQQYQAALDSVLTFDVLVPLHIESPTLALSCLRNSSATVNMTAFSPWIEGERITLSLLDLNGTFVANQSVTVGEQSSVSIFFDTNASLGFHLIRVTSSNKSLSLNTSFEVTISLYDSFHLEIDQFSAFYNEGLFMELHAWDSAGTVINTISVRLWLDSLEGVIELESANISTQLLVPFNSDVSPGGHLVCIEISGTWYTPQNHTLNIFVWIRTSIALVVTTNESNHTSGSTFQTMADNNSLGSIIRPPPILFNETTSVASDAVRSTSRDSCPRLSSGTSNRSTVSENSLTISVGNGQTTLNLRDLASCGLVASNSSTVLDVLPNDTIPHFADSGPVIITSVNMSFDALIFLSRRRISLS